MTCATSIKSDRFIKTTIRLKVLDLSKSHPWNTDSQVIGRQMSEHTEDIRRFVYYNGVHQLFTQKFTRI